MLAGRIDAAIQPFFVRSGDQHLADAGDAGKSDLAEDLRAGRNVAPCEHFQTLGLQRILKSRFRDAAFGGQKNHAHSQRFFRSEGDTGGSKQEFAGNSRHDADAVAALAVGGNGAAMRQPGQRRERLGKDFVRGLIAQIGNETDSAGVVFKTGI